MIEFNDKERIFHLSGDTFSYIFRILPDGYLQHLYYGSRVKIFNGFGELFPANACSFSPNFPGSHDCRYSQDTIRSEFSVYGTGDFRESSVLVRKADGSRITDFIFDGYEILPVKSRANGLPGLRGGETLIVRLKDSCSDLILKLYYTIYEKESAIVRRAELENHGDDVHILRFMSCCLDFPSGDYDRLSLDGAYAMEREPNRAPLTAGVFSTSSARGASSHAHNPFFALLAKETVEEDGTAFGFSLVYSGSFVFKTERDALGGVRVVGGINDFDFCWLLGRNEKFCSPEMVIVYSQNGIGGMSRKFHDLFRRYLLPQKKTEVPIVLNSWEAVGMNFDEEKLQSLIQGAARLGVEYFVLDDGWFGNRDDDRSGLGDWKPNLKKLGDGGLENISRICADNGLKFGLWIEPEMVSENSGLYKEHPDWCIHCKGLKHIESRNQLVLDLVNPDVREYLKKSLDALLKSADIRYVKWDMNRNLTENLSYTLPKERSAEFQHRYMLALYELLDYFTTNYPEIFFLGCAGGGGRYDAGMLYYFPVHWSSDNTDAVGRCLIQYGGSYVYPLCVSENHISSCPNLSLGRVTPLKTRADVASLGCLGMELNPNELSPQEREYLREVILRQKKIRELIKDGDVYRLKNPFSSNEFCMEIVSADKKTAYAVWINILATANSPNKRLRFLGLSREEIYTVEETGQSFSGEILMNVGLPLPLPFGDFISLTFTLNAVLQSNGGS